MLWTPYDIGHRFDGPSEVLVNTASNSSTGYNHILVSDSGLDIAGLLLPHTCLQLAEALGLPEKGLFALWALAAPLAMGEKLKREGGWPLVA